MTRDPKSMRSELGRARGLGSAKHGTDHWWKLRLTSLGLIPLSAYVFWTFFVTVAEGGQKEALNWLHSTPVAAAFVVLFVLFGFHHAANGVQVVIEDYVHGEKAKLGAIMLVKFFALLFALLGVLAVFKIVIGV